jgi:hypothetical protein
MVKGCCCSLKNKKNPTFVWVISQNAKFFNWPHYLWAPLHLIMGTVHGRFCAGARDIAGTRRRCFVKQKGTFNVQFTNA